MMGSGYGAHMMGGMWLWWIVGLGLLGLLVWVVGRTAGVRRRQAERTHQKRSSSAATRAGRSTGRITSAG